VRGDLFVADAARQSAPSRLIESLSAPAFFDPREFPARTPAMNPRPTVPDPAARDPFRVRRSRVGYEEGVTSESAHFRLGTFPNTQYPRLLT
jgi:hypothetical protein